MRGVTGSNYWGLGVLSRWPVSLRWLNGSHLKPRQKLCLPQGLAFLKLLGMMLMWLFCRWPEERSKGSFSSQHWKCVTWGVWNRWPPSTTLFWGVLTQPLSLPFFSWWASPSIQLPSPSSWSAVPPSVPRGWSTAAANRTQTLSAALKHKGSQSPEVFLGMFPVSNHRRSRSKTNKEGEETLQKHQRKAVCWQRAAQIEETVPHRLNFLEAVGHIFTYVDSGTSAGLHSVHPSPIC